MNYKYKQLQTVDVILTVAFVAVNAKLVTGMAIGKAFAGAAAIG